MIHSGREHKCTSNSLYPARPPTVYPARPPTVHVQQFVPGTTANRCDFKIRQLDLGREAVAGVVGRDDGREVCRLPRVQVMSAPCTGNEKRPRTVSPTTPWCRHTRFMAPYFTPRGQTARWTTTLSSKVNVPHAIDFRAVWGANLAT